TMHWLITHHKLFLERTAASLITQNKLMDIRQEITQAINLRIIFLKHGYFGTVLLLLNKMTLLNHLVSISVKRRANPSASRTQKCGQMSTPIWQKRLLEILGLNRPKLLQYP